MDKENARNIAYVLSGMILLCLFLIMFITLTFKPFSTGLVTKDFNLTMVEKIKEPMDTNKNCFYILGNDSISMYNCNNVNDCEDRIKDLKEEKDIKNKFDLENIEVLGCENIK